MSLSYGHGNFGITYEGFQELKKHFEKDCCPKEETLEALADKLKLTKNTVGFGSPR